MSLLRHLNFTLRVHLKTALFLPEQEGNTVTRVSVLVPAPPLIQGKLQKIGQTPHKQLAANAMEAHAACLKKNWRLQGLKTPRF